VREYDIVGHLHTKKSFDIQDREAIDAWYSFLLENLLGGKVGGHMADTVIAYMADHPTVGLVFPDDPNVIGWSGNRACAGPLAKRLGLSELPNDFSFPVGTMFWARTAVLKPFVALGLTWDDYPLEPLPYDGTTLHAIERLFGLVPAAQGLRCAVTHVPGVTR
jgi:lipopolysaccharide biosynthesis protein